MRFTKMQGLGNDYLYVYGEAPENAKDLCRSLSDRHFGAGSDGMIFISPSESADFKMRIFNADGSEAKMCGNGIRCVGKYVYEKGYTDKTRLRVETLSGVRLLQLVLFGKKVGAVAVDMGKAFAGEERKIDLCGEAIRYTPVEVGNPHAVIFTDSAESAPVETIGIRMQNIPDFPDGVNVELVEVLTRDKMRMRVYERGSGVTMACGTGSCAAVAAAVKKGYCDAGVPVTVRLDGGDLSVTVSGDGAVLMTGPAKTVYEGETTE